MVETSLLQEGEGVLDYSHQQTECDVLSVRQNESVGVVSSKQTSKY